jgi:hypothetical protein
VWRGVDWSSPPCHATLPTESHDSVRLRGQRIDSTRDHPTNECTFSMKPVGATQQSSTSRVS